LVAFRFTFVKIAQKSREYVRRNEGTTLPARQADIITSSKGVGLARVQNLHILIQKLECLKKRSSMDCLNHGKISRVSVTA